MTRLSQDYLDQAERDARRFTGQWSGTSGNLAAHVIRVLKDREAILKDHENLAEEIAAMRRAIEALRPAGQSISMAPPPVAEAACGELPDDLPDDFREANRRFTFAPAVPQPKATFDAAPVSATLSQGQLDAVWSGMRAKVEAAHERIRHAPAGGDDDDCVRIIGLTGRAAAGKSTVALMIPGAVVLQLADPIYAGLAAMFGLPESLLRSRTGKGMILDGYGRTTRQMLQTLGTEWGRNLVSQDVWITLLKKRVAMLISNGANVIAVADVRFENEAAAIRELAGGEVWHVARPGGQSDQHPSEAGVEVLEDDIVIQNDGSLDLLAERVADAFGAVAK